MKMKPLGKSEPYFEEMWSAVLSQMAFEIAKEGAVL
jgi:hypothetical protein